MTSPGGDFVRKGNLPKLPREYYQGLAMVHWSPTIENRQQGWLNASFHQTFREVQLHACARFHLACMEYVLMPDHGHLLWLGVNERSDQILAMEFLRRELRSYLAPAEWQSQAFDHVLRDYERERNAVVNTAQYILENPERAELVSDWREYPYLGSCVVGYPTLDPRIDDYWGRFWRCYNYLVERGTA